ncbi:MAG TPA: histidinol-phosphate transaminase [Polyangia bacterium]|nr:histidinol-phosphate transaminase [Polyangia bacterium]
MTADTKKTATIDSAALRAGARALLRPDIRAMSGYTPGEQVPGAVKLNTNECAYPPSPRVMETLARIADNSLRLYPDPVSRRLREVAAAVHGVAPEQILAGNGSDDCLTILYRAFMDGGAGDRVACPWPTYGLYETMASLQGVAIDRIPFHYQDGGRRWLLPEGLAASGAKLLMIANPNNPSSTLIPVDDLRRLCDASPGMVVVDEAYVDFATGDGTAASILPWLDQHPNLVVLRTFSKSYSLAGARLGLLFAAATLVAELNKVKDSYNVNVITQALGIAALEDRAYHAEIIARTLAERARVQAALAALGVTWPEAHGNFLLCDLGTRAEAIYRGLKAAGVIVRYWNTPELATRLRITIGSRDENDRLIAALRDEI